MVTSAPAGLNLARSGALTIPALLERHPWPADLAALGKPLEWLWTFDLAARPDELWRHLIDTSRFNRALGLSPMQFDERDGVLHGRARNGGFTQEWVELPWDWVHGRYLCAVRRYSRGFGHAIRVVYLLDESGSPDSPASRLHVYFGWIPRGLVGASMIRLGMPFIEKGYRRVLDALVRDLAAARPAAIYQQPPAPLTPERAARLEELRRQLIASGLDATLVGNLADHIASADDLDLTRIRVRERARAWGVDERALLRVCLHATRAGLLELTWDVVCPHCRGSGPGSSTLSDLPADGRCDYCQIDFTTDKENAIEITFHVHPSIRDVPNLHFCSAEPSSKEHVKVQRALAPGEEQRLDCRLSPGRYRMHLKGEQRYAWLDVVGNRSAAREAAWRASATDGEQAVAPDPALLLANDTAEPRIFVVEEAQWRDLALRPADLFNLQEFRDLFSEEYLGADLQLHVGEQTILFTDMVGSTRFYALRGDPGAFVEIRRHFAELFAVIDEHRGAVIKTIGDAVMAAFGDPVDALRASRAIHRRFHDRRDDTPIRLRISLNTGPCIAVRLNANIDYFGGTVNIAAKLQALAEAGEIAMAQSVCEAPGVAAYLAAEGAVLESLSYASKSLPAPVAVKRWSTFGRADGARE